ncbi:endonuclease I [Saccharothrix tamanrassetensis]|uniref:Endonuclease I n=1 Tax=Saccharothrix tamanrassetensis TaxID=1051531 RepID=A0A841CFN8_9PSEU|nr:endonuclease [Saccharothrix tamanrassetensis]MBB5955810.1 endonuclease I [Saccharothrix tamanrassetensis]
MTSDALQSRLATTRARYEGRAAQRKRGCASVARRGVLHTDAPHRVTRRLDRLGVDWQLASSVERGASPPVRGPRELDLERLIGRDTLVDAGFLESGVQAARAVGRLHVAGRWGTGLLIAPSLLLTASHVLPSVTEAASGSVEFDDVRVACRPELFFLSDMALDFTVVAVEEVPTLPPHLSLIEQEGKAILGERLNVVLFPAGGPKQFALRAHVLVDVLENFVHYEAGVGTSGAVVFNDQWEVVALHHSGVPATDDGGEPVTSDGLPWSPDLGEQRLAWRAGEGVRISRILRALRERPLSGPAAQLRARVFDPAPAPAETDAELRAALVNLDIGRSRVYYDAVADRAARDRYYADITVPHRSVLHGLLERTHVRRPAYRPVRMVYPWVDLHPDLKLRSLHSGAAVDPEDLIRADVAAEAARTRRFRELAAGGVPDPGTLPEEFDLLEAALPFNCEHVVPQALFGKREPMRGDLHHLFTRETGDADTSQPREGRGAVARATLYFLVRYPGIVDERRLSELVAWHRNDPVTEHELHRNAAIAEIQGNRNPFIDHPGWVLDV